MYRSYQCIQPTREGASGPHRHASKEFLVHFALLVFWLFPATCAIASDIQPCDASRTPGGRILQVKGTTVNVRTGPGTDFDRVKNYAASQILDTAVYATLDESFTVLEECTRGGWSKIRVIEPSYLGETHIGWVASRYLRERQTLTVGGVEYSDWHTGFNVEITRVLAANDIRYCKDYRYRINLSNQNEYLVHCKTGVNAWTPYLVSTTDGSAKPQ